MCVGGCVVLGCTQAPQCNDIGNSSSGLNERGCGQLQAH